MHGKSLNIPPYSEIEEKEGFCTENGKLYRQEWKLFRDLTGDELIATLNPETQEVEYHKPSNYFSYHYTGKMLKVEKDSLSLLVTPEHSMYVSQNGDYIENQRFSINQNSQSEFSFELIPAEDIGEQEVTYKTYGGEINSGSCFSVTADGYILTNRHVALGYYPEKRRVEHRPPNGPVTVPGTSVRAQYVATHMVACFGPKLADHFPCEVIYFDNTKERSRDIAILKCDKTFKNPILMAGAPKSGQAVRLSGFPGIVSHAYSKLEEEMRKMGARFKSGVREDLSYILFYSDNALASPSTTKGTISAIRGSDLETDARILKGNSGGPMLNADWKAVGIATWGIGNSGVNFAIRIDTLREEIESRIRKNRNR